MTEFEMAYLAQEMIISRTAQLSLIISIMSAFLVVGYTAAHHLTFTLNAMIVALYSLLLFPRIGQIIYSTDAVSGLSEAMAERFANGVEFQWNSLIASADGSFLSDYYVELYAVIWITMFFATIVFYFLARRMNMKREREAAGKLAGAVKVDAGQ